jgi:hypothetical protein
VLGPSDQVQGSISKADDITAGYAPSSCAGSVLPKLLFTTADPT